MHNFHDINGWLIIGLDGHKGIQFLPFAPGVFFIKLVCLHPFTLGKDEQPTVLFNGVPSVIKGHSPKFLWPHIGIIPSPFDLLTPLHIIFGEHKCWLPRGAVLICGSPATCCAIFGPISANADCWEIGKLPTSLVLQPGTVVTTPSLLDYLMGIGELILEAVIEYLLDKAIEFLTDLAFKALGKVFNAIMKRFPSLGDALREAIEKRPRLRSFLDAAQCHLTGHPVDVATGRVLTSAVDFTLPGPLPLIFKRQYDSTWSFRDSPLGHGWSHSLDCSVWLEPNCAVYRAGDGREIEFDTSELPGLAPRYGDQIYEPVNRLTLRCLGHRRWEIETNSGLVYEFGPIRGDEDIRMSRLVKQRSRRGHVIELHYSKEARLELVRDCGGRLIRFEHDDAGRLVKISLPHPMGIGWLPHTRYVYSDEGDLVEAVDPLGHSIKYVYEGHLLARETDRTGLSFYFRYDGRDAGAYCVRTYGDGGIYDHKILYDKAARVTSVTNSLGAVTRYEMNEAGAVVKVSDPLGGETRYEYDEHFNRVAEIDPLGNATRYVYDSRGNCTKIFARDGATTELEYDERNLPAVLTDPCGEQWRRRYDHDGQIIERENPFGNITKYSYVGGQISGIVDDAGKRTAFSHDGAKNLCSIQLASGAMVTYKHDALGRLLEIEDALGNVQRRHYDACGRLIRIEEPDGNVRRFTYDGEGNILEAQDHHRHIRFAYGGFHKLIKREVSGSILRFQYDTEDQLVEIENEVGENYQFSFDPCGRVCDERGFDGRACGYEFDAVGNLIRIKKASGAWIAIEYDGARRVTGVHRSDGTEDTYRYRADGRLIEAINAMTTVRFEYDAYGRVTREHQGNHLIESHYDSTGKRIGFRSSLGVEVAITRDSAGRDSVVSVQNDATCWETHRKRDAVGNEVERQLPSGIVTGWRRDGLGRPQTRTVRRHEAQEALPSLEYCWEVDERLTSLADSELGTTTFQYDDRAYVVSAQHPDGRMVYRSPDAMGRPYREPTRVSRSYHSGGALREADSVLYGYDADGYLVKKIEPGGLSWTYEWNGAGLLERVTRPDGQQVTFVYDALGRRIKRKSGGRDTTWIWDGDVPLHEIPVREEPVTWIFEPEGFTPLGKLQNGEYYGIVTDHLGTPAAMFGAGGVTVWQAQLDLYGRATTETATVRCPWRWPGQYEDEETGLYYNRFRYYDPNNGRFLSRDPRGLAGGRDLYGYPPDPLTWMDPFGLRSCKGPPVEAGEGGQFIDLDARGVKGDMLTPHHMPQAALGFTPRGEGGALVMPEAEHILTRTYGGKGRVTAAADAGLSFREALARDIWDVKTITGSTYNEGLRDVIRYYRENFPELLYDLSDVSYGAFK